VSRTDARGMYIKHVIPKMPSKHASRKGGCIALARTHWPCEFANIRQ